MGWRLNLQINRVAGADNKLHAKGGWKVRRGEAVVFERNIERALPCFKSLLQTRHKTEYVGNFNSSPCASGEGLRFKFIEDM